MSLLVYNIPVRVIPPVFPAGYCPTMQEFANDLASGLQFSLSGPYSGLIISAEEPVAADRSKLWLRLIGPTGPVDRFYLYLNGRWSWPHEVRPGTKRRIWIEGTEAEIKAEDGGNTNAVGDYDGPFWAIDHNYDRRSPMGPGTNVETSETLDVSENEGAEGVTLEAENLKHFHGTGASVEGPPDAPTWVKRAWSLAASVASLAQDWTDGPANFTSSITGGDRGTTDPIVEDGTENEEVSVIHPVRGVYCCSRTARIGWTPV